MTSAQQYYEKGLAYYQEGDDEQAYSQFSAAAELGHAEAQVWVGKHYLAEAAKSATQAFGWFQKAVAQNPDNATANYQLSYCYEHGCGTITNDSAALHYLLQAATLGDIDAQVRLGERYLKGEGVPENKAKAWQWLQEALAQNPTHAAANYTLGLYYDYLAADNPTISDYVYEENAYRHYLCAAKQGHIEAQYEVGTSIIFGSPEKELKLYGFLDEKLDWLQKVLAQDAKHVKALYALGSLYECGGTELSDNTKEADRTAFLYYMRAANLGYPYAQQAIGLYYRDGNKGIEEDPVVWLIWYEKAAEGGLSALYWDLGQSVERGLFGLAKDEERALEYYKEGYALGVTKCYPPLNKLCKKLGIEPPPQRTDACEAPYFQDDIDPYDLEYELDDVPEDEPSEAKKPALDRLNALIGLDDVKREINRFIMMQSFGKRLKSLGKRVAPISMHMIFTGNPGTGKTTVARLIGEIFHERGFLSTGAYVEVKREDLVGSYIGETALKTREKIEAAKGGVLFIDEAYTLYNANERDFGKEAVATLLTGMEEYRDDLVVIAAGYGKEMQTFLGSNPGLKSRFKTVIDFQDYDAKALNQIFHKIADDYEYHIEASAEPLLEQYFEQLYLTRGDNFGNAREVRNFYETVLSHTIMRLYEVQSLTFDDFVLTKDDIQAAIDELEDSPDSECAENPGKENTPVLEQLNAMVGLESVKNEVRTLRHLAAYRQLRQKCGKPMSEPPAMHMVFTGNPGTGKTTVAKMVGEIYHELGLLPQGHVVVVKREDLVGTHIGETAPKTKKAIAQAMGGVLFIDEAYALIQGSEHDFGPEAISTLLAEMEEQRENMAVIVAGYENEMRRFIGSNPGLKSRFTKYVHFEDYNGEELAQIFRRFAAKDAYTFGEGAEDALDALCAEMYRRRDKNFGNARDVRNLFADVIGNLADRVSGGENFSEAELLQITKADILKAAEKWARTHKPAPEPFKPRKIGFNPED